MMKAVKLEVSVCHCDCDDEMLESALKVVDEAVNNSDKTLVPQNVADIVKLKMDCMYPPSRWNTVVGSYGAFVTPKRGQFVHVAVENCYSILMFKCQSENEFALNKHTAKQRNSNRSSSLSHSSPPIANNSNKQRHTVSTTSPQTKCTMSPIVTSPTYTNTNKDTPPSMDSVTSFGLEHHYDGVIAHAVDSILIKKDRELKDFNDFPHESHHLIADAQDSIIIKKKRDFHE